MSAMRLGSLSRRNPVSGCTRLRVVRSLGMAIILLTFLLAATAFAIPATDVVQTILLTRAPVSSPPPTTLSESFIVTAPPTPTAIVILLPGGTGILQLTPDGLGSGTLNVNSANFLVRSRALFAGHNFYTISLDAATDFQLLPNGLTDQRSSSAYISDVLTVIAWARAAEPGLPVWVVGTSRGNGGAFVAALYSPGAGGPNGLAFTSAVNSTTDPDSLLKANLASITVPVFLLNDSGNTCTGTTTAGQAAVIAALTSSPRVSALELGSASLTPLTDNCHEYADHGYFGLEDKAVFNIALFITGSPIVTAAQYPAPNTSHLKFFLTVPPDLQPLGQCDALATAPASLGSACYESSTAPVVGKSCGLSSTCNPCPVGRTITVTGMSSSSDNGTFTISRFVNAGAVKVRASSGMTLSAQSGTASFSAGCVQ
ncbi:MAG: hypothetical protein JOZ80_05385 [Acidobacteriaceae bacterium]|nr:hypothetical protein [Acidobacteriaceae bacterium]